MYFRCMAYMIQKHTISGIMRWGLIPFRRSDRQTDRHRHRYRHRQMAKVPTKERTLNTGSAPSRFRLSVKSSSTRVRDLSFSIIYYFWFPSINLKHVLPFPGAWPQSPYKPLICTPILGQNVELQIKLRNCFLNWKSGHPRTQLTFSHSQDDYFLNQSAVYLYLNVLYR